MSNNKPMKTEVRSSNPIKLGKRASKLMSQLTARTAAERTRAKTEQPNKPVA